MSDFLEELKNLQLTDEDFDLLVEGLDSLPEKGFAGEMMSELISTVIGPTSSQAHQLLRVEREKRAKEKKQKNQLRCDDIKILQGKLIMLKRYLIQQGALRQANDILKK